MMRVLIVLTSHPALLSPLAPEFFDPSTRAWYDRDRETWHVFGHADVKRVLTDTAVFSRQHGDPDWHPTFAVMWAADDPRHSDLRSVVADPFRQSVLSDLEPMITQIVSELLDDIERGGPSFNAMAALGRPLPLRVICHIMGVDLTHDALFARWLDEVASRVTLDTNPDQPDMIAYFTDLLNERRGRPQGGLVDRLIAEQLRGYMVAGQPLSDRDLIGYLFGLTAAGADTTATTLVNTLVFLSAYGLIDAVRADHELVNTAIEEAMRWYPAFPATLTTAKDDVALDGQSIAAGQSVTAWISAANRDPERFPDPNSFNIRRRPNTHLSFGHGPYHCLGAPLARLELRTALPAVLKRLPGLRWESDRPFSRTPGIVHRVNEARFTFDR
jgi:cytochrome P450